MPESPDDIICVCRTIKYTGRREEVKRQLERSLPQNTVIRLGSKILILIEPRDWITTSLTLEQFNAEVSKHETSFPRDNYQEGYDASKTGEPLERPE